MSLRVLRKRPVKKFICPPRKVVFGDRDTVTTQVAAELMGEDEVTQEDHGGWRETQRAKDKLW